MRKKDYLKKQIQHIDMKKFDSTKLIEGYQNMAFQARNLAKAARLYAAMLSDKKCTIILCLAGSIFSAGLKRVVYDLIMSNMVDVIVSAGAIIVDQDFFESVGFKHYIGTSLVNDHQLQKLHIDRIYDTYIDENELKICDAAIAKIADRLPKRPHSSREFLIAMGKYLLKHAKNKESVVLAAYKKHLPIFVPAFSDCSAGFGLVYHQTKNLKNPLTIDSVKDFRELTDIKVAAKETGLLMIGGGVPKNFAQDVVIAAEVLKKYVPMHKYAVQITTADERDGALSGSTLREAHSWGKINEGFEQMVFSEATIAFPIIASYAYHKKYWKSRKPKRYNKLLEELNK